MDFQNLRKKCFTPTYKIYVLIYCTSHLTNNFRDLVLKRCPREEPQHFLDIFILLRGGAQEWLVFISPILIDLTFHYPARTQVKPLPAIYLTRSVPLLRHWIPQLRRGIIKLRERFLAALLAFVKWPLFAPIFLENKQILKRKLDGCGRLLGCHDGVGGNQEFLFWGKSSTFCPLAQYVFGRSWVSTRPAALAVTFVSRSCVKITSKANIDSS